MIDTSILKKELPSWIVENDSLTQHFEFANFKFAFGFMMKIQLVPSLNSNATLGYIAHEI